MVAFVSKEPPVKKAWSEGLIISKSRPSTAGKSPTALRRLIRQGEQAAAGSGSAAPATKDATSSSITLTSEHTLDDVLHDSVRTRPPTGRFVVLSFSSADTDIPAASQVALSVPPLQTSASMPATESAGNDHSLPDLEHATGTLSTTPSHDSSADDFYESQTVNSAFAINVYVPNWNITNNARVDDSIICRNLLDHVTPLDYWAALRNQGDVGFLDAFNINIAQHICMASELRLRYEHEIMTRENFEKKYTDSAATVQQRDVVSDDLRVRLKKSKAEVAKVIELRKRVSDLEATVIVKVGDLASLRTENEEFVSQQDVAERRFKECVTKLDARIADVRHDMDNDLYPHMLTAIAGRSLEAGVVHGKAGRSLAQIKAYDPEVEGKYVVVVSEFEGVFS
ncbi:hypothetical protein Tco_1528415, partial [Tanacetum coccineum]